jgi:hypothetical protein
MGASQLIFIMFFLKLNYLLVIVKLVAVTVGDDGLGSSATKA